MPTHRTLPRPFLMSRPMTTLTVHNHPEGVVVEIWVQPRAKQNAFLGIHDGKWRIALTAPAQQGRANAALMAFLAEWLHLRRSQIVLLRGQTHRHKTLLLRDVTENQLRQHLRSLFSEGE